MTSSRRLGSPKFGMSWMFAKSRNREGVDSRKISSDLHSAKQELLTRTFELLVIQRQEERRRDKVGSTTSSAFSKHI